MNDDAPRDSASCEVNLQDLIFATLQRNPGLDRQVAEIYVTAFLKAMTEFIILRQPVRLPNIGLFYVTQLPARPGFIPSTRQRITIASRPIVRFRPSHNLKPKTT